MTEIAEQLPLELYTTVQNLIDGNQVKADELILIDSAVKPFELTISVDWEFHASWTDETIAGGEDSHQHFGYNERGFDNRHEYNVETAQTDPSIRQSFLNNLYEAGEAGLLQSSQEYTVSNLGTHSFNYDCTACNAKGKVECLDCYGRGENKCRDCNGMGYVWEEYIFSVENGRNVYDSRKVPCVPCHTLGKIKCYHCHNGKITCKKCSGYCYYTHYRDTKVVASPSVYYYATSPLYVNEIIDSLVTQGLKFSYEKFSLTNVSLNSPDTYTARFSYMGTSVVMQIVTELRGVIHTVAAYSNPPYPFIRPPIFDQLFEEEILELQQINQHTGTAKNQLAAKFFDHFINQPVLSHALKAIAVTRKQENTDSSYIIYDACHGYISQQASHDFAQGIHAILDKVSPPYHKFTWVIWQLLAWIVILFIAETAFETTFLHGIWQIIGYFLYCFFVLTLIFTLLSLPVIILSYIILSYKRRNVPTEYQQNTRHREILWRSIKVGMFMIILGGGYGIMAIKDQVPKLNYQPMLWLNAKLPKWNGESIGRKGCLYWKQNMPYFYPNFCDGMIDEISQLAPAYTPNSAVTASASAPLSNKQKILYIQTVLSTSYPDVKPTGNFDAITQKRAIEWLNKANKPVAKNAKQAEIFKAFNLDATNSP